MSINVSCLWIYILIWSVWGYEVSKCFMSMDLTYLLGVWGYEVSINISFPCILHYLLGGMCGAMRYLLMFHVYGFNIFAWSVQSNEVSNNVSCLWI